jgi:hypothetical protein
MAADRPRSGAADGWISEQDGMTVIRTDYYGAAALREENAAAEKATQGRRFGDWVRVASVPLDELAASGCGDSATCRTYRA